jgi:hypothetical protein
VSWFWQLPLQQSHWALQLIVARRQFAPSGRQPDGLRQTPTLAPAVIMHVVGAPEVPGRPVEPQQSESCAHDSPGM